MELQDILNLALVREQTLIELYTDLLESYKNLGEADKDIEDLFLFLINEKARHKQLIKEKIGNFFHAGKNNQLKLQI